jgi:hypothetical protein
MSGFSAAWLALREPADRAARDRELLQAIGRHFALHTKVTVTDLACGTGATVRALQPHLPRIQSWHLVDNDRALLAQAARFLAARSGAPEQVDWRLHALDLQAEIETAVALESELLATSSFLDLVSARWLERLVSAAAAWRRPVYAALSYDGRIRCEPPDPLDDAVRAAFNAHQQRDKGFGAALGPAAAGMALQLLIARGYRTRSGPSDWRLAPHDAELQERLIAAWHEAASEQEPVRAADFAAWRDRRLAALAADASHLWVGHRDIWAYLP